MPSYYITDIQRQPGLVLSAASDFEFRAQAYANYLESCANAYTDLISACSEAADDGYEPDETETTKTVQERVDDILARYQLTGTTSICLNEGYTTLNTLLSTIMTNSDSYADLGNIDIYDQTLQLTNAAGASTDKLLSVTQISDELNATLQSTVATAAGLYASVCTSVSDRINVFTSKMQSFFKDGYDQVSTTVTYVKGLISNTASSCSDICSSIMEELGLDNLAEDDNSTVSNTNIYAYTGASPVAAVDFSTAKNIVTASAKIVAGVVVTVAKTVWNKIVKPIFNWAKAKVTQLFENPYDLEVINNENAKPSIDGWMREHKLNKFDVLGGYSAQFWTATVHNGPSYPRLFSSWLTDEVANITKSWYKFEFICGELLLKVDKLYAKYIPYDESDTHYPEWRDYVDITSMVQSGSIPVEDIPVLSGSNFYIDATMQFKPFCLHTATLKDCLREAANNSLWWWGVDLENNDLKVELNYHYSSDHKEEASIELASILDTAFTKLRETGVANPEIATDNEEDMINSFEDSITLMNDILDWMIDSYEKQLVGGIADKGEIILTKSKARTGAAYSNADWVAVASGWNKDTDNPSFSSGFTDTKIGKLFRLVFAQQLQKKVCPLNYPFIPYQQNQQTFATAKYRIKDDATNQAALTTFLTTATIAVITAAVVITGVSIAKKIKRDRYFKRAKFVGTCDQSLWTSSDPMLTSSQRRKYVRYKRKMDASSLFGSNLATSAGANVLQDLSTSLFGNEDDKVVGILRTLITGN